MARIAGVNIPDNKHVIIALTSIYGVGKTTSKQICEKVKVDPATKVSELSNEQLESFREVIAKFHQNSP